jgi:hypothetical protein
VTGVEAGFFSLSGGAEGGDDEAYLRWHLLDHLPEQYASPGLRLGTRGRADEECLALRWVATDALAPVRHAVAYLMTDPLDDTLREFVALAGRLRDEDRFPHRATSHLLGAYELEHTAVSPAAVVSAAALPFRPHRGVLLLVESPGPAPDPSELVAVDGVAGVMSFRSSARLGIGPEQGQRYGMPLWDPGDRRITIVHLDADLSDVVPRLEAPVRARWASGDVVPELAAPFRSMVSYQVLSG